MKKKIFYEKGVLLEFDTMDTLSNGDIFLHGTKISNIGGIVLFASENGMMQDVSDEVRQAIAHTNSKVVDISSRVQQPVQPEKPPVRKAMPPKKEEPRIGLMCPKCHQSRAMFTNKEGQGYGSIIVIVSKEDPADFLITTDILWNTVQGYNLEDQEDVLKFLQAPDISIQNMLQGEWIEKTELTLALADCINGHCDLCGAVNPIQSWVNEYAQPTSLYAHTCRICGGEMCFTCNTGVFNPNQANQTLKCERCEYESGYNLSSK